MGVTKWKDMKCDDCGHVMRIGDYPYCPHESIYVRDAQVATPTVVFRSKSGKYRFPGRANAPTPKGYQRIELNTQRAKDKFEKEFGAAETAKLRENFYREQADWEWKVSQNMAGLEQLRDMSPTGRMMYEQCMKDIEQRRRREPSGEAGFYIESNHQYAGNRSAWCDQDTGWKDRK